MCDYCSGNEYESVVFGIVSFLGKDKTSLNISVLPDKKALRATLFEKKKVHSGSLVPIEYCPKCGREL